MIWNDNFSLHRFHPSVNDIQLYCNVHYTLLSWKNCGCNVQVICNRDVRVFLCIEWMAFCGQNNILKFLVVPTRRHITMKFKITKSAGKLPVCTFVLIYILPLLVFVQCSVLSPSREMRLFVFCWGFFLFQVPLTSCASPWRAGGTRKGASLKYCLYYVA